MHLAPGHSVGRYVIESLLGEGGMGTVYQARDTRLERKVALKVLRKEADGDVSSQAWEDAVMRIQREAQAVAALSHPGIVAIYDIGDDQGAPFIAMELVAGQPLRELVGTDLPSSVRWRMLVDVARALGAAHEAGFLHRDIKPENILVRPDNSVKVLDFGIARRTTHVDAKTPLDPHAPTIASAAAQMTADGVLVGTPAYMAPEQVRGEPLDARVDQFAWGVVAYELLTGTHPFSMHKGVPALLAAVLGDTPAPPENVPEGIAYIVMRALAKDPAERWHSMQDIVAEAEPYFTSDEVRPPSVKSSPPRNVEERPTLDLPAPHVLSTPPVQPTPPAVAPVLATPTAPARRSKKLSGVVAGLAMLFVVAVGVWLSRRTTIEWEPKSTVSVASTVPTASAMTITDLPLPASSSGEARAAFREGIQSVRDARWAAAGAAFQRARKADPEMAIAHLRYAIVVHSSDIASAREAYRTALGLRRTLSERDAALLHAVEPMIQRAPPDYAAAAQRFEPLVGQHPLDVEFLYWYGESHSRSRLSKESQERAIEIADRCIKLDPNYADCRQSKTLALLYLERTDEALAAVNACIAQCDNAIDCLQDKVAIESSRGRCNETVEASRQLAAKDALAPAPQRMLTEALFFSGAGESAVRAAAQEAIRLFRAQKLDFDAQAIDAFTDIGFGDFEAALRQYEIVSNPAVAPSAKRAKDMQMARIELLIEMNQWEKAASLARDALEGYAKPDGSPRDLFDPFLPLQSVLLHAGKISRKQYDAARTEWLARSQPTNPMETQITWLLGHGMPAYSKDLANEALVAAERMNPTINLDQSPLGIIWATYYGRSLMLVGKPREALPYLERATRMCVETTASIWYLQSIAALGKAYEATGNESKACEMYGKLLDRWGRAKPSVTAKDVSERAGKLKCKLAGP